MGAVMRIIKKIVHLILSIFMANKRVFGQMNDIQIHSLIWQMQWLSIRDILNIIKHESITIIIIIIIKMDNNNNNNEEREIIIMLTIKYKNYFADYSFFRIFPYFVFFLIFVFQSFYIAQ